MSYPSTTESDYTVNGSGYTQVDIVDPATASSAGWVMQPSGWYKTPSGYYVEPNAKKGAKAHQHDNPNYRPVKKGGGGGGMSINDIFKAYLKWAPEIAKQMYASTELYQPQYAALMQRILSGARDSDLADIKRLAPSLQGIRNAAERPDVVSARDTLYKQIADELAMGEKLTADQSRSVEQSVRSAQAARGLGTGTADANIESVKRALQGQALAGQRRNAAASMLSMEASQAPDPFSIILGLGGQTVGTAANQATTGASALTPATMGQMYSAQQAANQAQAQYNLALQMAQSNPWLYK